MNEAETTRREFIRLSGLATVGATLGSNSAAPQSASQSTAVSFDINDAFNQFMKEIGADPLDAGGLVTFTGSDPTLRSHFRIGSAMAILAMGAGVGAAAIWRERTGQAQDLRVDLRESVYNVNPIVGMILLKQQQAGRVPPSDPLPSNFNFLKPTVNGLLLQAPIGFGNPMCDPAWKSDPLRRGIGVQN